MNRPTVHYPALLTVIALALCLTCGKNPFETSSSIGKSILAGATPAPLDAAGAFKIFNDSLPVLSARSFIDRDDSLHSGLHLTGGVITCGNQFVRQSVGYISFDTAGINSVFRSHGDSLGSINLMLTVSTSDTSHPSRSTDITISVYAASARPAGSAFVPDSTMLLSRDTLLSSAYSLNIPLFFTSDGFPINQHDTTLPGKISSFIIIATIPKDTVIRFSSAALLRVISGNANHDTTSLTNSSSSYIVFESGQLEDQPISVWESNRVTVIKLQCSKLWDAMLGSDNNLFRGILEASLEVVVDSARFEKTDSTIVRCAISDSLTSIYNTAFSLSKNSNSLVITSGSVVTLPLESFFQTLIEKGKPDSCFLYLSIEKSTHNWGEVHWTATPQTQFRLHATFSNPR